MGGKKMAKINYTYRPGINRKKKYKNDIEISNETNEDSIIDKETKKNPISDEIIEKSIDEKIINETIENKTLEEQSFTENIIEEDAIEINLNKNDDFKGGLKMNQGSYQELIENQVIFALPPKDGVIEIANVKRNVEISQVDIITDNAIVKGFLHTSVLYNTVPRKEGHSLRKDDYDDKDGKNEKDGRGDRDKVDCDPIDKKYIVDGVVRHSNSWIPFEFLIPVQGAKKGDNYKIEYAGVAQDAFVQCIIYDEEDSRVFGPQNNPFIKGFKEKDTVKVAINVY